MEFLIFIYTSLAAVFIGFIIFKNVEEYTTTKKHNQLLERLQKKYCKEWEVRLVKRR